jgi:hypothetical protein
MQLHDPLYFKGTGYSSAERDRLGMHAYSEPATLGCMA